MATGTRLFALMLRAPSTSSRRLSSSLSALPASTDGISGDASRVYFLNQHSEPPLPFREAMRCLRAYSITEKPETVDVNVKCNMKRPKGAGSIAQFRGTLIYPHTFRVGKETKILVFCEDDEIKLLAREAGANEIGGMEFLDLIREKGLPPCDLCISTPQMAPHLMEFQKTLKAKMPTEKKGTVVQDVIGAIKLFKNSFQYKSEQGIVNMAIGRLYFNDDELEDNFNHLIQTITKHRDVLPQSKFIKEVTITTTYGPGFKLTQPYIK